METHKRSMIRSICWRLIGILVLTIITFAVTDNLIQTSFIIFLHHFVFIWVYYLHERLWQHIRCEGKKRVVFRICLYELVLGQGILALISLIVTGSLQKMTFITILYIGNKLWLFALYDKVWSRIKWNTQEKKSC